jgi:alpha-tubulin suppressor-like RCC1 family protein
MDHGPATLSRATAVSVGALHSCALLDDGTVRCWGRGEFGQHGYGHTDDIGDDEAPGEQPPVELSAPAVQISAGLTHTCALLTTSGVQCWGHNAFGQLGYGHTLDIGDDETPASSGEVVLGVNVAAIAAGGNHTCVLTEAGRVRCWGDNTNGQLGLPGLEDTGDDELPDRLEDVDLGPEAITELVAGQVHSCVLLEGGRVRCWGRGRRPTDNAVGGHGQLGYGNTEDVGDDEPPVAAGDVDVGALAVDLAAGFVHTCAITDVGAVRCWGRAEGRQGLGQLGYQQQENIGDNEVPASAGDIDVGARATRVSAGDVSTCAIDGSNAVRCWGFGGFGQLGYARMDNVGDDEPPSSAGPIDIGGPVSQIAIGQFHACALTTEGRVVCFGLANSGQLGYCRESNIGDDEAPAAAGFVPL